MLWQEKYIGLKQSTLVFSIEYYEVIEMKESIKYLEDIVNKKLKYNDQIQVTIANARQKFG